MHSCNSSATVFLGTVAAALAQGLHKRVRGDSVTPVNLSEAKASCSAALQRNG